MQIVHKSAIKIIQAYYNIMTFCITIQSDLFILLVYLLVFLGCSAIKYSENCNLALQLNILQLS